jgi:hypothetical protein
MLYRTGEFVATTESGSTETILVYTGFIVAQPPEGPPELLREEPEFRTASGLEVEKIGPDTYLVRSTGQILRSTVPTSL